MQNLGMSIVLLAHQARRLRLYPRLALHARRRRVLTIVTPIQRAHDLRKDAPHEVLIGVFTILRQLLDVPTQVAIATVLHIQMQIVGGLEVLARDKLDDVGVFEGGEVPQFLVELLALFRGHAAVGYLFATVDLAGRLEAHFADYAEGALA